MLRNRLIYIAVLAALVIFFSMYNGAFAFRLLLFALIIPFCSFALAAVCASRVSFKVESTDTVGRGCEAAVSIEARYKGFVPCPAMYAVVTCDFPYTQRQVIRELTANKRQSVAVVPDHYYIVDFTVERVCITDWFGLFCITKKINAHRSVAVVPLSGNVRADIPVIAGTPRSAEAYEVREYRPGDLLRMAHWKLTSKTGRLMIKEPLASEDADVVLAIDLLPPSDEFDALLDELAAVSASLCRDSVTHLIARQGKNGVKSAKVSDRRGFEKAVSAILTEECVSPVQFEAEGFFSCPICHISEAEVVG